MKTIKLMMGLFLIILAICVLSCITYLYFTPEFHNSGNRWVLIVIWILGAAEVVYMIRECVLIYYREEETENKKEEIIEAPVKIGDIFTDKLWNEDEIQILAISTNGKYFKYKYIRIEGRVHYSDSRFTIEKYVLLDKFIKINKL